jgi:hypothetical protein
MTVNKHFRTCMRALAAGHLSDWRECQGYRDAHHTARKASNAMRSVVCALEAQP